MSQNELGWETVRVIDQAQVPGVDLLYAEFPEEEYVHIEVTETGQAISWSTTQDFKTFVGNMLTTLGQVPDDPDCWSYARFDNNDDLEDTSITVLNKVLERPSDVAYFVAGYTDCVVSWTKPKVKMQEGSVLYSEAGCGGEHITAEVVINLLGKMATPRVVAAVNENEQPLSAYFS